MRGNDVFENWTCFYLVVLYLKKQMFRLLGHAQKSSAPLSEISFIMSVQLRNNLTYFMMHSVHLNFTSLPMLIERRNRFSHLHWIVLLLGELRNCKK